MGATAAPAATTDVEVIVPAAEFAAGIAFSSDGTRMYFSERAGTIREVRNGRLQDDPLAEIPTTTEGEAGALGIALAPNERDLYIFATDPDGSANSILRVPVGGGEPQVVVSGLPSSVYHNGGGVAFDEDGMLLVSNGEVHDSTAAQNPEVLGGKIYRFTPAGEPAPGNPFGSAIALGLRNPFGLTVDPVTGDAFVTDNGPSSDDEINRIQRGSNYGWPDLLGAAEGEPSGPGTYRLPVSVQPDIVVPTGIAIADPATAKRSFAGDVFYGTYGERALHRIELDDTRNHAVSDEIFIQEEEPIVAVEWGPGGLYYSTPTSIKRVQLAQKNRSSPAPEPSSSEQRLVGPPLAPDPGFDVPWRLIWAAVVFLVLGVVVVRLARN